MLEGGRGGKGGILGHSTLSRRNTDCSILSDKILPLLHIRSYTQNVHVFPNKSDQTGEKEIQWNLSIADTLVTAESVLISEVSTFQG